MSKFSADEYMTRNVMSWPGPIPKEREEMLTRLTVDNVPEWLDWLDEGMANMRALHRQLAALIEPASGQCAQCGRSFRGRSDRKFCSDDCRQRGHRSRKRAVT